MSAEEKVFRDIIDAIAKERNYENYKVAIKPLSSGGANFSALLFLATISTQNKEIHLFAKVAAQREKLRETLSSDYYVNEQYFYANILKRYKEIEEKYDVKAEDRLLTPECFAASSEYLRETLVLEDLSARGFQAFNRFEPFDWQYASFAIKQLAIFHALSIAYNKEYPSEYENSVNVKLSKFPFEAMTPALEQAFEKIMDVVKEENKAKVIQLLKNPKLRRPLHKMYEPTGVPVIRHADFRPDNMMHKILDDGTIKVVTLDYQTLSEGSPVADLVNFIMLGSDKKYREKHLQESFDLYYKEFRAALHRFNIDSDEVYSQQTYQKELQEYLPYMLTLSFLFILVLTADKDNQPGSSFEHMKPNKLYAERINDLIDDFIDLEVQ